MDEPTSENEAENKVGNVHMEKPVRFTTCVFCDGGCLVAGVCDGDGSLKVMPANPQAPVMCSKATLVDEYRLHPNRVLHPRKRVGERGEAQWADISWDQALSEIAQRLQAVIDEYGPVAFAVSEMPLNTGFGGITRRFMNHIGSPNYLAPTQLCMGNTAQVHRAVYGWFATADWEQTDCVVYFGQDRDGERWPGEYQKLCAALKRGATLIEIDPRETETAKKAQYHLRIRYGTDAALALSWIQVIIEEGLYDREFVETFCTGFDELRRRVATYTPEVVAEICEIDAGLIRETARVYANASAAIIPWGVVGDMQANSTALLQAQCILRALCGYLNKSEKVFGPAVGGVTNAQLADFSVLSPEARKLQLGYNTHPLLTFAASECYAEATARFGIPYEPDILAQSCSAIAPDVFAAMRGEGPYLVKAFFAVGNNTVMSYANQQGIVEALMNQDLVVVFDHWMTPTAQLADYVLPADMWAERDVLGPAMDIAPLFMVGQALCERPQECKSWYFVVKGLADRMGMSDVFPWADEYELYDFRLAPLGVTWKDAYSLAPRPVMCKPPAMGKFATPSGKVELVSSVLASLGLDPLPAYVEHADACADAERFPYVIFAGYRERRSYNTNLHQMSALREQEPEPLVFVNPADAKAEGVSAGDWCAVETAYGSIELMVKVDDAQPAGTLRVPHGWWKPESEQGLSGGLSCANKHNDAVLFPDDAWNLDGPQGVPNLRGGIRARIVIK